MLVHGVLYLLFLESKKMGLHYQFSQSCYTNGLCKAVFWLCQFAWEFFPTDTRALLCGVNVFSKGMDFYDLKVNLVQYEAYILTALVAVTSSVATKAHPHWRCRSSLEQPMRGSWNPTPSTRSTASPGRPSPHPAWRGWSTALKCWRSLWSQRATWELCK